MKQTSATVKFIACNIQKSNTSLQIESNKIPTKTFAPCFLQHSSIARRKNIATSKNHNCNIKYLCKLPTATSSTSQINYCNVQKFLLQHHADLVVSGSLAAGPELTPALRRHPHAGVPAVEPRAGLAADLGAAVVELPRPDLAAPPPQRSRSRVSRAASPKLRGSLGHRRGGAPTTRPGAH